MKFWVFMLVMDLLIPATMIGFGARFRQTAPVEINFTFGYRTRRSMASREAWAYAHRLIGRIWLWAGVALLPLTVAAFIPLLGEGEDTVGLWGGALCMGQLLPMIASILPVEIGLRRHFYPNGERRSPDRPSK